MPRASRTRLPPLDLALQYGVRPADAPDRHRLRRWVRAAQQGPAQVALRLVDETEGRELNRAYRGKDYPTNVLTFVYDDMPGTLCGDLVLCAPVVSREAREQGKTAEAHYAHLVVHGMLHLAGYDHENDADAQAMEARESQIVTALGYADPYSHHGG